MIAIINEINETILEHKTVYLNTLHMKYATFLPYKEKSRFKKSPFLFVIVSLKRKKADFFRCVSLEKTVSPQSKEKDN